MAVAAGTSLPSDFSDTLESVRELGILNEQATAINDRLAEAVRDAAVRSGQKPMDAGWSDWIGSVLSETKLAIHQELCATDESGLKKEYNDLITKGLTTDGIAAVSVVIVQIVNPTFAVSSVVIYLSVWLFKMGLNRWCKYPPTEAVGLKK
jgi:hypothetical protein